MIMAFCQHRLCKNEIFGIIITIFSSTFFRIGRKVPILHEIQKSIKVKWLDIGINVYRKWLERGWIFPTKAAIV